MIVSGKTLEVSALTGEILKQDGVHEGGFDVELLKRGRLLPQQSTFFSIAQFKKVGGLKQNYHLAMDYELWQRLVQMCPTITVISDVLAVWRIHETMKSVRYRRKQIWEAIDAVRDNWGKVPDEWLRRYSAALTHQLRKSRYKVIRGMGYALCTGVHKMLVLRYRVGGRYEPPLMSQI